MIYVIYISKKIHLARACRAFIEITMFLRKSKHVRSRISSRDRQYLKCFQSVSCYKSFCISTIFWKLPAYPPGFLRGDIFLFASLRIYFTMNKTKNFFLDKSHRIQQRTLVKLVKLKMI